MHYPHPVYGETYNVCEKKARRTKFNIIRQSILYANDVVVLGRAVKRYDKCSITYALT
jgi:hypothetical protein